MVNHIRIDGGQASLRGMTMKGNNNLLTAEQMAEILQVHLLTVYGYIRRGKIDAVRLGRSYRIIPEDLRLFIESNRISGCQAGLRANDRGS